MPATPLLGITELSPNQTGKETTINDAILALEAAGNAVLPVDMSTGDVILSVAQFTRSFVFSTMAGLTAARILNIPAQVNGRNTQRVFVVANSDTTYNVTVQITGGAGGKVAVNPGKSVILAADGAGNITKLQTVNDVKFYGVGGFAISDIEESEVLTDHVVTDSFVFAANFDGSYASVGTNPAAAFVLSIRKNNVEVGQISIATTGAATFTSTDGAPVNIAAGDVISVVAPAVADTFIKRLRWTLKGTL